MIYAHFGVILCRYIVWMGLQEIQGSLEEFQGLELKDQFLGASGGHFQRSSKMSRAFWE